MTRITLIIYLLFTIGSIQAQEWAINALEQSPRHQETITLKAGDREISAFVVYPEVSENVPVVILIHENRGLNDWARLMADQVAEAGYIVIAPDFISGMAPDGGNTPDFENSDAARDAIYKLEPSMVTAVLDAAVNYAERIPSSNDKVAVMGFCWGGSQTFRYATNSSGVDAFYVFYGSGPENQEAIEKINAPVYGFYGGEDHRVNATIENSTRMMETAGKVYKPVIYEGAGHGFMRAGQDPEANEANKKAFEKGFERLKELLKRL